MAFDDYFVGGSSSALAFIVSGREQTEAAAGGESAGTVGVPFGTILRHSSYHPEVKALYNEAQAVGRPEGPVEPREPHPGPGRPAVAACTLGAHRSAPGAGA
jgi:hypothetical protein